MYTDRRLSKLPNVSLKDCKATLQSREIYRDIQNVVQTSLAGNGRLTILPPATMSARFAEHLHSTRKKHRWGKRITKFATNTRIRDAETRRDAATYTITSTAQN